MAKYIKNIVFYILFIVFVVGCGENTSKTTQTLSTEFISIEDKIEFLEKYVTFRRPYLSLDYSIDFINGSGWVPSPSEWDIRLVAKVPKKHLDIWVENLTALKSPPTLNWCEKVKTVIDYTGVNEWYSSEKKLVGVDRVNGIVLYRNHTM